MSSASSSMATPALMRRRFAWLSTRRLKGMSREAESAIMGTDVDMELLQDGPAGSLSPDPRPVTKTASALSL